MEDLTNSQIRKAFLIVIIGILVIIFALLMSIAFQFSLVGNLLMSWLLTTGYAIFAIFLVDPRITINPVRTIEKEVIREVPIEVEREVIREIQVPQIEFVEKEVIREVPVEVEKIIYRTIERTHRKLNIPKYKFIGSNQTKTYHKRTCKFSKMLKNKYKLHSNSKAFFKRKHYKACKACINTNKK